LKNSYLDFQKKKNPFPPSPTLQKCRKKKSVGYSLEKCQRKEWFGYLLELKNKKSEIEAKKERKMI
jgi:hypothetical protein